MFSSLMTGILLAFQGGIDAKAVPIDCGEVVQPELPS
jgi:hypothetical protein